MKIINYYIHKLNMMTKNITQLIYHINKSIYKPSNFCIKKNLLSKCH